MVRRAGAIAGSQHDRAAAATRFAGNLLLTVAADGRSLVRHSFDRGLGGQFRQPLRQTAGIAGFPYRSKRILTRRWQGSGSFGARFDGCDGGRERHAAQVGRAQLAMAAKMMKMNADNAASIIQVIEAAQQNLGQLANGLGQNLDITV
jgi:hypothetical protein